MKRLPKVLSAAQYTAASNASPINVNAKDKSVLVGKEGGSNYGYIGRVCESSRTRNAFDAPVWFNFGFPSVIGIFGRRGTGKSFNLGVFAECLAGSSQASVGESSPPAIVIFDVQNQFWTLSSAPDSKIDKQQMKALSNWKLKPEAISNVCCWVPSNSDSGLPDAKKYKISPSQLSESDWLSLVEQERFSPMGQALLEILRQNPNHTPQQLAKFTNPKILSNFQHASIDSLRWRLESISSSDLIGEPGIDVGQFLVPGRVSIILLRNLPESLRALTAAILTRLLGGKMTDFHQKLKLARRGKAKMPTENLPKQLWLMLDEAHVIAPGEKPTAANAPLIDYVKRGRDSGLSLVFATQQPSAVDNKLMSQVDMTLTHALGFEADVQAAVARMPTSKPIGYSYRGISLNSPGDIIRSLKPGQSIIADSANPYPFIMSVRPRLSAHGGDTPS